MEVFTEGKNLEKTRKLIDAFLKDFDGVYIVDSVHEKARVQEWVRDHYQDKLMDFVKRKLPQEVFREEKAGLIRIIDKKMKMVVTFQELKTKDFPESKVHELNAYVDNAERILFDLLAIKGLKLKALAFFERK